MAVYRPSWLSVCFLRYKGRILTRTGIKEYTMRCVFSRTSCPVLMRGQDGKSLQAGAGEVIPELDVLSTSSFRGRMGSRASWLVGLAAVVSSGLHQGTLPQ